MKRIWSIVDQALPVPYDIGGGNLDAPDWNAMTASLGETYAARRRFASLRAYHDSGSINADEMNYNSRLIGRSVWNTRWLLIIPAGTLHSDTDNALKWFIRGNGSEGGVKDIKLFFKTYSYSGN